MFNCNPAVARPMGQTFEEFDALAKTCAHQARLLRQMASDAQGAAIEMWGRAREYQRAAADLNGGSVPDIGDEPLK
jgi:hypothetical protein